MYRLAVTIQEMELDFCWETLSDKNLKSSANEWSGLENSKLNR